jgi:hypothetical protein
MCWRSLLPHHRAKGNRESEAVGVRGGAGVPGVLASVPRRRHTRGDRSPRPRTRYAAHLDGGPPPALSGAPDQAAHPPRDVAVREARRGPRVPGRRHRGRGHARSRGRWGETVPGGRHALRCTAWPSSERGTRGRARPRLPAPSGGRKCDVSSIRQPHIPRPCNPLRANS